MISAVLLMTGVISAVIFMLLLVFRRDLIGVDLSARSVVRLYLYLASLAAVIVLAIGVSALLDWGTASAFGSAVGLAIPAAPQLLLLTVTLGGATLNADLVGATLNADLVSPTLAVTLRP